MPERKEPFGASRLLVVEDLRRGGRRMEVGLPRSFRSVWEIPRDFMRFSLISMPCTCSNSFFSKSAPRLIDVNCEIFSSFPSDCKLSILGDTPSLILSLSRLSKA